MGRFKREISLIYIFCFFRMFLIFIPVLVPFFQDKGLNMQEIFILQGIFGLTVALFEVPSGYLCDFIGRKKTLTVGTFLSGLAFTFLYFCETFVDFIIFEVAVGLAMSFISGADFSLLYDSFPDHKRANDLKTKAVAQAYFSLGFAESLASLIGGVLVLNSFRAVLMGQLIVGWIPFIITFFLIEKPRTKPSLDHYNNLKKIFTSLLRREIKVRFLFINQICWGLATFIAVWIFQKYWSEENISLALFGPLWAAYNLTVAVGGKFVPQFFKSYGARWILVLLGGFPIIGYLGLGVFSSFFGVVIGLSFQLSRAINQVFIKDQLNKHFDSTFRATLNSISSLFFRGGFFIIGPIVGFSIDQFGLRTTFFSLAFIFSCLFLLVLRPLIKIFSRE